MVLCGCRASPLEHWVVGQTELRSGEPERAIESLQRTCRLDPEFAPAYLALAAAYSRQGEFEAVAINLRQYLLLNPEHVVARVYLAECLLTLGDHEGGRREYEAFLREAAVDEPENLPRALHCAQKLESMAAERGDRFAEELWGGAADYLRGRILPEDATGSEEKRVERLLAAMARFRRARTIQPGHPELQRWTDRARACLGERPSEPKAPDDDGSARDIRREATRKRIEELILSPSRSHP